MKAEIEIGSTWSDGERTLAVVDITETELILLAPLDDIKSIEPVTEQILLGEWTLEESPDTPQEVMLDIAAASADIEPFMDPEFWLDKVKDAVAVDDDSVRLVISSILEAGVTSGRLTTIGKKYALDQDWIESVHKLLDKED